MSRYGSTTGVDLAGPFLGGVAASQRSRGLDQNQEAMRQHAAQVQFNQQQDLEQRRVEAERYAVTHDADSRIYAALRDAMSESQSPGFEAQGPSPQDPMASYRAAGATGPGGAMPGSGVLAPGMGGAAPDPVAALQQVGSGPQPAGPAPMARPAPAATAQPGRSQAQAGAQPAAPLPAMAPAPSFAHRIMARINDTTLAHASPRAQAMIERALTEQGEFADKMQRDRAAFAQMAGAGALKFYQGDTADQQGLEDLVDKLDFMVEMGAMNEADIYKNANPQVAQAFQQRRVGHMNQQLEYLSTQYDPTTGASAYDPSVKAQMAGMGPKLVQTMFVKKREADMAAATKRSLLQVQQQQAQQAYAVVNDPKATPAQRAQAQAVLAAANMPLGQQTQHRPDAGPEFDQDVADLMALHPTITRERAVAYVRSKLHGLSTMEPANISGKLRGGKASTVVIDAADGPMHILQGNGEVIRWGPGNQWAGIFMEQAEKMVPKNPPGNKLSRVLPSWMGGTSGKDIESYESQRKLDVEAKAKELAQQAGFEIDGGTTLASSGPGAAAAQAAGPATQPARASAPAVKGPRAQTPPVAPDSHYPEDAMGQPFMLAPDQVETARQATREAIQALAVNGHKPTAEEIKAWILQNKVQ